MRNGSRVTDKTQTICKHCMKIMPYTAANIKKFFILTFINFSFTFNLWKKKFIKSSFLHHAQGSQVSRNEREIRISTSSHAHMPHMVFLPLKKKYAINFSGAPLSLWKQLETSTSPISLSTATLTKILIIILLIIISNNHFECFWFVLHLYLSAITIEFL